MTMFMFIGMSMAMSMPVIVAPSAMIMFMQEERTDDVQRQSHTPHNQHQLRVLNMLEIDKAFHRLQEYAQPESKQECAVEKGTEQIGAGPAEGQVCRRSFALGHVDSDKGDDETDKVIEVMEGVGDESEGFCVEADGDFGEEEEEGLHRCRWG